MQFSPAAAARFGATALELAAPPNPCHRCGRPATTQWQRNGTDAEAEQHWAALEAHIRSQSNLFGSENAEYVADRSEPVAKAVFGCDEHDLSPAPADGGDEATAAAKQAGAELRSLSHDADCGGHGACGCGGGSHV
jgi:hypothetical protein